ncbi:RagB/SusD family nutrient uptake outer membrane protein [uncultured Parabacteroides sp.]|uniref:RagB/SusD family nutrient uptake outer membrane protein n=1 Tax=uncultured Parabacteroides sp. TaxID=512312 RepID=UPI00259AF043|nr:RagB/SusD family nutrient uptake outer membrane protein [uncultured Parabacteroides sp.]
MKNIRFLFSIIMVMATLTACDDGILNLKNPNAYDTGTFFTNPVELQQATNAIYSGLYFSGLYSREYYFIFDLAGNDAAPDTPLEAELAEFALFTYNGSNEYLELYWRSLYRIILRANLAVDKSKEYLGSSKGTDEEKALVTRCIAEAKFLKSWAYFELVTSFGRVPVKKTFAELEINHTPRSEVSEIWAYIEELLKEAIPDLPESYTKPDYGRATSGAANALLGKSYLYQAKYAEAISAFEKVNGELLPFDKYHWNFSDQDEEENNVESIFQVQIKYIPGSRVWGYGNVEQGEPAGTCHTARSMEYGFNDWANVYVSQGVASQFRYKDNQGNMIDDPRGPQTFYGTTNYAVGKMTYLDFTDNPKTYDNSLGLRFRKYQNYERIEFEKQPQSSNNINIIRYADVLLMHAEALIMNGNVSEGMDVLNRVRERAGVFKWEGISDKNTAMEKVKHERVLELTGEQVRFKDLIRWGEAKQVLNKELAIQYGPGTYFQDKHVLLPIPVEEINTNNAVANDIRDNWN